jgi:hypothetical protein
MSDQENVRFDLAGTLGSSPSNYYWYYYYYFFESADVAERLDPSSAFLAAGTVEADASSSGISGLLSGWIALAQDVTPPFGSVAVHCFSRDHRFEMRRR